LSLAHGRLLVFDQFIPSQVAGAPHLSWVMRSALER
jgi:hypothetical protein